MALPVLPPLNKSRKAVAMLSKPSVTVSLTFSLPWQYNKNIINQNTLQPQYVCIIFFCITLIFVFISTSCFISTNIKSMMNVYYLPFIVSYGCDIYCKSLLICYTILAVYIFKIKSKSYDIEF